MDKSRTRFVIFILCILIALSAVEAIQGSDQDDNVIIPNAFNQLLFGQAQRTFKEKKFFLNQGIDNQVYFDWAQSLKNQLGLQDGLNVSKECGRQLERFSANLVEALSNLTSPLELFEEKNWSIKVIDSFGKLPSGVLVGGFGLLGDYSECVGITNDDWQGKYCQIDKGFLNQALPSSIPFLIGICIPEPCSSADVKIIAASVLNSLPKDLANIFSSNDTSIRCQEKIPFDSVAISASVIVALFVLVALVATIYDVYKQHLCKQNQVHSDTESSMKIDESKEDAPQTKKSGKFLQIVEVFSVYTNSKRLFDISSNNADQIDSLNAIRVITLGWVILCHCYIFMFGLIENKTDLLKMSDRFSFNILTHGFFSVDTFFLLSGFLTSHLFFKEMRKPRAKITPGFILKYYFHRYWRLTPVYMMCIYMSAAFTPYTSVGPFHSGADGYEPNRCRKSWWTNLLYINNFGIVENQPCFGESWYLANDMQYYWLSPLILIPLSAKNKKYHIVGFILSAVLLIQSFITIALTLHANPESAKGTLGPEGTYFFNKVYVKPWARIQPFLVGIFLAYLLTFQSASRTKFKFKWITNILLWTFFLALMIIVLFGMDGALSTRVLSINTFIVYECLSRLTWAIGLAGVIFLCYTSNGYFINSILSWKVWRPFAKLNYSAYLVHPTVIYIFMSNMKKLFYISDINMVWYFGSTIMYTFALAFVVSLLFEIPFIRMEKFFFKQRR